MPTVPQQTSTEPSGQRLEVSSLDGSRPDTQEPQSAPALLFVFEFPPSSEATAGPILMARLLKGHPNDKLHVLAGSHFLKKFQAGRIDCHHLSFPQTSNTGRWGLGRLKQLLELMLMPALVIYCWRVIRRYRIEAVLSLAHGIFFVEAAVAARLSRVPFILVVHDDWLEFMRSRMWVPSAVARWCYRRVLRSATKIYAVSPGMQQALRQEYGVESEVQLPATEAQAASADPGSACDTLRIAFAGTVMPATIPSIDLLVKALQSPALSGTKWSLDIYGAYPSYLRQTGWDDERIHAHRWAPQPEMRAALRQADVLYLPYAFDDDQLRFVQTSFPSKLADYLAAGKPVLICAPPESGVMPYAREGGFAELVDRPDVDLLAAALLRLATSPEYRQRLAVRGLQVFAKNHDIARQQREFMACIARLVQQPGKLCEPAPSPSVRNAAQPGTYRVLIIFNTIYLYGMERATIETFDLLRPEVEPLFLMTYTAHRLDLPVLREMKRRQLPHTFLSDWQGWPRLAKPTSTLHFLRMLWAFVRGNVDSLRAAQGQDAIYLPYEGYLGLALLPVLWFRLTGRRVLLHFHNLVPNPTSAERSACRFITDAIHNTELGMKIVLAGNPALRHKRNAVLSIRTDASQSDNPDSELRRQFAGTRNLFFVGQVSHLKGTDLLLDAVKLLAPDHPDLALHLFGGCADEARLRADISSRGLGEVVHLWGFREDVVGLLRYAEILVHSTPPSRVAESFGRSVAEAMAKGVPAVCFRSGGLPEMVDHGRTGWVCDSESAAALADGIRALLEDSSLRERMALAGREKYQTNFADATVRKRWMEWLRP